MADWLANRILDLGIPEIRGMQPNIVLTPGCRVLITSDGACRGNPGLASAAAIIQLMSPCNKLRVAAWCTISLGVSTSVHAEFESAILGQRLFVDMCRVAAWSTIV